MFVSYRSIIMAELLSVEKLTSSFGLVTMCQGLSAFIGAPIAGNLVLGYCLFLLHPTFRDITDRVVCLNENNVG